MSFLETLVILLVAVVVLGPKRLPEAARKIGHWTGVLRRATDEFKRQLMTMDQQVERTVSRAEQSLHDATGDLDDLVPEDDELPATVATAPALSTTAVPHPDELPPAASPDDMWGMPPVAGGLATETPPPVATPAPSVPETPAEVAPAVVLNPTSFEREATEFKPRSLGLSATTPPASATKEAPRG